MFLYYFGLGIYGHIGKWLINDYFECFLNQNIKVTKGYLSRILYYSNQRLYKGFDIIVYIMKDVADNKNSSKSNVNRTKGNLKVNRNINPDMDDIDIEDIFDVMGCKTRRDIINLLKEEPMFVSEISNELNIGQKAIIAHLRAMEEMGILNSSYKKIMRGRPRKYYDLHHDVTINITINKMGLNVSIPEDMLMTPQLPSGDEWSKLLEIEKKIDNGQLEAIEELKNQIRLYNNLKERAEYILERTLKNRWKFYFSLLVK